MAKKYFPFILAGILFLSGIGIGYFVLDKIIPRGEQAPEEQTSSNDKLFFKQSAYIRGRINQVSDNQLKVTSLNNTAGTVAVSENVIIISPSKKITKGDLTSLQLNKEVVIGLEMFEGKYQVVSIQYMPPMSSPKPAPSLTTSVRPQATP